MKQASSDQILYQSTASNCAARLGLPFSNYKWQGQNGDFAGSGTGSSMDFQDHKDYAPGDDPRHINWQAYARSGNYILKQFQEEVRPSVDVIFDVSPSMFFEEEKKRLSCELFYMVHEIALKSGADIQCHLISGSDYQPVSRDQILSSQWAQVITQTANSESVIAPHIHRIALKPGSIRIFISDLLFEADPSSVLQHLGMKQGKVILLAPYTEKEADPNWSGNYDFIDAETGSKNTYKIDSTSLKTYMKKYSSHFTLWAESLQRYQAKMVQLNANIPTFESLSIEAIPKQIFTLI